MQADVLRLHSVQDFQEVQLLRLLGAGNHHEARVQSKIIQKESKHQSKIDQTSIQNRPKIDFKSTKITAGAKNVAHFVLGAVLGAVLEASWARLRGQHSPKLASQIEGKSIKNRCKNRSNI